MDDAACSITQKSNCPNYNQNNRDDVQKIAHNEMFDLLMIDLF